MTAQAILDEMSQRGITARVDGEILLLKPREALDDDLLARIKEHKPEILEVLRNPPATFSPDCYELEPGIWIHRRHVGCTTTKPEALEPQRKLAATCELVRRYAQHGVTQARDEIRPASR